MSYAADQAIKTNNPDYQAQLRIYERASVLFDQINDEYAEAVSRWQEAHENAATEALMNVRKSLRAQTNKRLGGVEAWYEREVAKFGENAIAWNRMVELAHPGVD